MTLMDGIRRLSASQHPQHHNSAVVDENTAPGGPQASPQPFMDKLRRLSSAGDGHAAHEAPVGFHDRMRRKSSAGAEEHPPVAGNQFFDRMRRKSSFGQDENAHPAGPGFHDRMRRGSATSSGNGQQLGLSPPSSGGGMFASLGRRVSVDPGAVSQLEAAGYDRSRAMHHLRATGGDIEESSRQLGHEKHCQRNGWYDTSHYDNNCPVCQERGPLAGSGHVLTNTAEKDESAIA